VYVIDISVKEKNNIVEKINVVKARDKQAVNVVINYKGDKEAINNNKKVFNVFNNSKDKDYKKSSENKDAISKNRGGLGVSEVNSSNNKKRLSEVNVNKSDNKDYIKTGDNSREVSTVRGDKNISEKKSC
jgi:hypothetical protein